MKILEKAKTSSGIDMQIEDWSKSYPGIFSYGDTLAAYPRSLINPKEQIRLEIRFANYEESKNALKLLESGEKRLIDYKEKFSCDNEKIIDIYFN